MTNAVAEAPPAAESQTANPTPDSQATAKPQGDVASPSAQAGTDGEQSASSTAQTATTPDASAPAKPETPEAAVATPERTLSAEEAIEVATQRLQAQKKADDDAEALKKTQGELRDLRRDGPKHVRGWLKDLEKGELDVADFRENVENHIESLNAKALEAARLEIGDSGSEALQDEQKAFVNSCYAAIDPAKRADFTAEVDGKGHEAWVKATQKYAPKAPGVLSVTDLTTEASAYAAEAANGLSAEEQTALTEALKGAKTAKAVIEAVGKAMRGKGRSDPGEAVAGNGRASNGPSSRAEAEQMHAGLHPSGQRITNAQMRQYLATGQI